MHPCWPAASGPEGPHYSRPVVVQAFRPADPVPPLSWTCPMHPEVVNDQAGTCPICRMKLVPIRLDTAWSCPVHEGIAAPRAGRCPICGRGLLRVTIGLSGGWVG